MKVLRDEDLIRGDVPMTKFKVRAITFFNLGIEKGDRFLDIGSGTGSISVQAGLFGADVTAIDNNSEACELTKTNAKNHGVDLKIIEGKAPENLPNCVFDKCFIGGSMKSLGGIFDYLEMNLSPNGVICANFILISNLNEYVEEIKKRKLGNLSVSLVQSAEMKENGLFIGENPIYITTVRRV